MKNALVILICISAVFIILAVRPVRIAAEHCKTITGTVSEIQIGSSNDIIFILSNDPHLYYINRGMEQGLKIEELKEELLQQKVKLSFVKHWTPLDPLGKLKRVVRLKISEKLVFTEQVR